MFAGSLDLTYVGPGPALNAHFKSNGAEVRIISGAANGGAALVVKAGFTDQNARGFSRKENRDAAARKHAGHFLPRLAESAGLQNHADSAVMRIVIPTSNPDQLALFQKRQRRCSLDRGTVGDATGTRSRNGKIFLEDKDVADDVARFAARNFSANIATSPKKSRQANVELTRVDEAHPEEAQQKLIAELKAETRSRLCAGSGRAGMEANRVHDGGSARSCHQGSRRTEKTPAFSRAHRILSKLLETP